MEGIVAHRYAVSFFEVAKEDSSLDEMLSQLKSLEEIFHNNGDLLKILCTPVVTKEEKLSILDEVFGTRVELYLLNFLKILTEKGRMSEFYSIVSHFKKLYNHENNIKEVVAVTAVPLSEALLEKLKIRLTEITHKTIVLSNEVDKSILGGVVLKMEDDQIDNSIQSRLEQLRSSMLTMIA